MKSIASRAGWALMAICLAGAFAQAGEAKKLDKGLLDSSWFGPQVEFRATEDIDYIWVKEGFTVKGKKLKIDAWSDPDLLNKDRDAKDSAKASELTELMPSRLRGALAATLSGVAETSKEDGDLVVTGRFVDCNAGSKAAKFLVGMGAGAATATFDIKIVDKASGDLVAAVHHRVISGTSMSEIDDKLAKWLEHFGNEMKSDLSIAASGKVAKK
jgi:hypothetical protein